LLDDEDVAPYAATALGKLGAGEARSALELHLESSQPLLGREAERRWRNAADFRRCLSGVNRMRCSPACAVIAPYSILPRRFFA
jgi:hypothetical protein